VAVLPTKLEAKTRYRMAFSQWLRLGGWNAPQPARSELERIMDEMQSLITPRPGPEWEAFIDTIPGFREAWKLSNIPIPPKKGGTP